MSHSSRTVTALLTLAVALGGLAAGSGSAAAGEKAEGVVRVHNGREPAAGLQHIYLEEVWRAGHEDDGLLFGLITKVVEDADGDLYVLDAQMSQAHVFDRRGKHLRTLFGEGDGPGEVRGPRDLVLLGDGRVAAVQEMPGKLIFVDRQNNPAGELGIGGPGVSHGGFCQTFSAFARQDLLLVAGFVQKPAAEPGHLQQTSFLSGFAPDGRVTAEFCADTSDIDFAQFVFEENRHLAAYWWNAAIGPDGKVYVAPYLDSYEIHVFDPDGTLRRIIERECEPWRRSKAEKERFVEIVKAIYGDAPIEVDVAPADSEPMIVTSQRGLRVHSDGTIWVLTTHGVRAREPGVMATFDVFSPEGEFQRQVAIHSDADPEHDGIWLLSGDRAVIVKGFVDAALVQFTGGRLPVDLGSEGATMELVCCRRVNP